MYWLRDGKVWPALRQVTDTDGVASAALGELYTGPDRAGTNLVEIPLRMTR